MSGSSVGRGVEAGADDGVWIEDASTPSAVRTEKLAVGDEIRIPVVAEELTARVRPVEVGAVRIEKRIVSEDQVLEVPVTEQEIRVERRIVDRPVSGTDSQTFEQIIIEVPLQKEMVDVEKQAHVAEEIVVTKEVIQRTERVTDTVRREEVRIDEGDG